MKRIMFLLFSTGVLLFAQEEAEKKWVNQWAGAGLYWNQDNSPQINGALAYAKRVTVVGGHPGYSFTRVNIWSITRADPNSSYWTTNYRVATSTETGWAQHITDFGRFSVFGTFTGGPMFSGSDDGTTVGAALSTGGFAMTSLGRGWTGGIALTFLKPMVNETNNPGASKWSWSIGFIGGWGE